MYHKITWLGAILENWIPDQFAETILFKDSATTLCIFLTPVELQDLLDKFSGFSFQSLSNWGSKI